MKINKQWQGKWIMDPVFDGLMPIDVFHKELSEQSVEEHLDELMNRHMLVRKKFTLKEKGHKTTIDITADDYYKLYINGSFVGQGPAPGYFFSYKYNQFDISDYVVEGENVIAVHIYYQGLINRVYTSGDYRQGMIAEVFVDHECYLSTDSTWKYQISEAYKTRGTTGYQTQYLEDFDSRLWEADWIKEAYDDHDWAYVIEHPTYDYTFKPLECASLSVTTIKPKNVACYDDRRYLIDFGQEITGQFQMTAKGDSGQIIEIRCAEELLEGNPHRVRYKLRCNCDYQEFWTLSGQMDTLNTYDYKAFRYVEVITDGTVVIQGDFRAVVRHYPFEEHKFTYVSSDKIVDQIIEICKNGVKYGAQEVYVDCPTREKGQYLGDFTVSGHSHIYLTGDTKLYKKTLADFADSTFICPGIMAVAPASFNQEIADFSLEWPMQLHQYYRHSGDRDFLEQMYDTLVGLETYFKRYEREDGLLINVDEKWNLVDWPDNLRDGYDCNLTIPIGSECHNVINAHYYGMLAYSEKIRLILGMEPKHDLDKIKEAFIKAFYHKGQTLFVDKEGSEHASIHANALPMFYGLFPDDQLSSAIELMTEGANRCGVQMSYFVLKALAKSGEQKTVYKLIQQLWKTMVDEGATTCFEAWGKDQKWNTSLCHPWASAPIPVMIEDVLGINPGEPGWKSVEFKPNLPEEIEDFRMSFFVKTGEIVVEKIKGQLVIKLPEEIRRA